MPKIKCFDDVNLPIKGEFESKVNQYTSEKEERLIALNLIAENYKKLISELNTIKKNLSIPVDKVEIPQDLSASLIQKEQPAQTPVIEEIDNKYKLDGVTPNTYISPSGKRIIFAANSTSLDSVKVLKGGDLDEVLATLTKQLGAEKAKENIKNFIKLAIKPYIQEDDLEAGITIGEPTSKSENSLEAKKDDIERRRQEELNRETPVKNENITVDFGGGVFVKYQVITYKDGSVKISTPFGKAKRYNELSDEVFRDYAKIDFESDAKGIIKTELVKNDYTDKQSQEVQVAKDKTINAKYDAELAALLPKKDETKKEATILVNNEDRSKMDIQMDDDLEVSIELREKIREQAKLFKPEKWEEIEEFLKDNFPNIPVYRVKHIITGTNGLQAWGMFKNGAIYVYEGAEVGTAYHEVFEAVWSIFTTPQEKTNVLKEFKQRKGSFVDRPTGRTIKYKDATNQEAKEQLAEEFRDYVLNKKQPSDNLLKRLFKQLVDFINTFFNNPSNTDKLFKKIGTGYYKQYNPLDHKLSFSKAGIIDIDQAFADSDAELRLKNMTAVQEHEVLQQMTYLTFDALIKNNKSLFKLDDIPKDKLYEKLLDATQKTILKRVKAAKLELEAGNISPEQAQRDIENGEILWKTVTVNWDEIKKSHEQYLKKYNIEFDENDEAVVKDEDKGKNSDHYADSSKVDHFKKANPAIKLLLATLPLIDKTTGKPYLSSIGGNVLLPYGQVAITLMNKLHSSRSLSEMINRIRELAQQDPSYQKLYTNLTKNTNSISELNDVHDAQLLSAFWHFFKKQNPEVKNVYLFENGQVGVGDSNLNTAVNQLTSEYSSGIRRKLKTSPFFKYDKDKKAYIGIPASVAKLTTNTIPSKLDFLKSIGIDFDSSGITKYPELSDKLNKAIEGIKATISKADNIFSFTTKTLDIKGRLREIAEIQAQLNNPEFDSVFYNGEGEKVQTFMGTSPMSDLYDFVSQAKNKEELRNTLYSYIITDSFSKNSVILNKIFNKDTGAKIAKTEHYLKQGWADSTINTVKNKNKSSSRQNYRERLIQEINLNLSGYYYNLVPADSSREVMTYMGNHIKQGDNYLDIFKGYLIDEINISREDRIVAKDRKKKELRFFSGILSESLHNKIINSEETPETIYQENKKEIDNSIKKFVEEQTNELFDLLEKYSIIEQNGEGLYNTDNLALSNTTNSKKEYLLSDIENITLNYIVANIEFHKIFFSDPFQYKDELKRIKNANSPRQAIVNNSPDFNSLINKVWNKPFQKGDLGYTDMTRDAFRSVVLNDVKATFKPLDYGIYKETDGGGIITMKAYRLLRIKAGMWNDLEESQYQYDIAFEKDDKGIKLTKSERALLEKGNPEVKSAYTPLKPIVFGNKGNTDYNNVLLDKYALYPLSYRVIKQINPEATGIKLYNKLQDENIDYVVFDSGRKVGTEGSNVAYNPKDGSFNTEPYIDIVDVPHHIIAIQTEVPSKEDNTVSRGTQITKLVTLDYMEAGVPIDYDTKNKDFNSRYANWNNLTYKEKRDPKNSSLYNEIETNNDLLKELTNVGFENLLSRTGLKKEGNSYIVDSPEKMAQTLRDEIIRRDPNNNILKALDRFEKGTAIIESTPLYQLIRNILYSIADKEVITPKLTGGQKVQIPVTFLESNDLKVEEVNGKKAFTSDTLSFYTDKDGQRVAEVMVGRWFDSDMSDEELLEHLNKPENQDLLFGVAFRIPTQNHNSIDVFKIKKFLPKEFGDSVVIPSALVKKVGSDFDVDKLSMYFKNTFKDVKGMVKSIPYYGIGKDAISKLEKDYDDGQFLTEKQRKIINKWIENRKDEDRDEATEALFISIFGADKFNDTYIDETVDDFLDSYSNKEIKDKIIQRIYKKSLENGYIQSIENLVSNSLNFKNLTKPNSADYLKKLSDDITELTGNISVSYTNVTNMLKRPFMSKLRQDFLDGKRMIGIAAVSQTNHSLNQRQAVYVDPEKSELSSQEDLFWLTGGTNEKSDITLKFKKFNKININGTDYPTLSFIENQDKKYISDIIGQIIDGTVDIAKDPWIVRLGITPSNAGTWLFLIKSGVPVKDIAYFMNQPIIREYTTALETDGYSWLFREDYVQDMFKSEKYYLEYPKKVNTIPSNLKDTINKEKFNQNEKAEQQFILREFLKYAKMAQHLYYVTNGTNFDTATLNDPLLIFKKQEQLKRALSSIFSGVEGLLNNSFIGNAAEKLSEIREAYSEILVSDKPNVRNVIQTTLLPYINTPDREFVKIARNVVNSLFDWVVQKDQNINADIRKALIENNGYTREISNFVISVKQDRKHPLHNNIVINSITPHFTDKDGGVNNIKIKNKENKTYDQNQIIYSFQEIEQYLNNINSDLYDKIVKLAILQGGLTSSPISYLNMLPYDSVADIYNISLSKINDIQDLYLFNKLNIFERSNWNNSDIVPVREAKWSTKGKYNTNMKFFGYDNVQKAIDQDKIPKLVKINSKSGISNNDIIIYTWEEGTSQQKAEMRKKGDYSYKKRGLFKKVYKNNEPLTLSFSIGDALITDFVYKQINAWGESYKLDGAYFGAKEYYSSQRPSEINNNFLETTEMSDNQILQYFDNKIITEEISSDDQIPNCI